MKKSLNNRFKGKRLVTGDENEITDHEILLKEENNKVVLKERGTDGKIKQISTEEDDNNGYKVWYNVAGTDSNNTTVCIWKKGTENSLEEFLNLDLFPSFSNELSEIQYKSKTMFVSWNECYDSNVIQIQDVLYLYQNSYDYATIIISPKAKNIKGIIGIMEKSDTTFSTNEFVTLSRTNYYASYPFYLNNGKSSKVMLYEPSSNTLVLLTEGTIASITIMDFEQNKNSDIVKQTIETLKVYARTKANLTVTINDEQINYTKLK